MSDPSLENKMADFFNGLISSLVTGGELAAEAYIAGVDPALMAIPPIKWLVDEGIEYLGHLIGAFLATNATNIVIDVQTNGQNSKAVVAATTLKYAIASGNKDAIAKAIKEATQAYADLGHWDGVARIP